MDPTQVLSSRVDNVMKSFDVDATKSLMVVKDILNSFDRNSKPGQNKIRLLRLLMSDLKNLDIAGVKKKEIVKRVLKICSEYARDKFGTNEWLDDMWLDENVDFLIDQFVELAPKLFKAGFVTKARRKLVKLGKVCGACGA